MPFQQKYKYYNSSYNKQTDSLKKKMINVNSNCTVSVVQLGGALYTSARGQRTPQHYFASIYITDKTARYRHPTHCWNGFWIIFLDTPYSHSNILGNAPVRVVHLGQWLRLGLVLDSRWKTTDESSYLVHFLREDDFKVARTRAETVPRCMRRLERWV